MAFLMDSKYLLAELVYFIFDPFLNMEVICFINSAKFGINLLTKFIFPRKDWISFFDLGIDKVYIVLTLSGSILTLATETTCPNSLLLLKQTVTF